MEDRDVLYVDALALELLQCHYNFLRWDSRPSQDGMIGTIFASYL
jgi:hypothetical protein